MTGMSEPSSAIKNHAQFIWSVADLLRGGGLQAERVRQGRPAAHGAAPLRLRAGAREGGHVVHARTAGRQGGIYGLEADYATFSRRGERGDHDLWGQHLKNLLARLGASAAALVDWDFFTIEGKDLCRVSIVPSDHPVYEARGEEQIFWWRTPVGTDRITDARERDRLIARRWAS